VGTARSVRRRLHHHSGVWAKLVGVHRRPGAGRVRCSGSARGRSGAALTGKRKTMRCRAWPGYPLGYPAPARLEARLEVRRLGELQGCRA
jgi:hypothetical protein